MDIPLRKVEFNDKTIWINNPEGIQNLIDRRKKAFDVALGKFIDSNGNIETVLQTGEAFGRGVYSDLIINKPEEWTMQDWIESIVNDIFNPMGNAFAFTEISENNVKTLLTKCPLNETESEKNIATLFNYGFMRGLLKSAFPKGEVLMKTTMVKESPVIEFEFKNFASYKDKSERERVKHSVMKINNI